MQPSHSSCQLLKVLCFDNEERHVITEILRKFALNTNQSIIIGHPGSLCCLYEGSCLIQVICVCLRREWCPTHIVLCFFLSSSCVYCQFLWIVHFCCPFDILQRLLEQFVFRQTFENYSRPFELLFYLHRSCSPRPLFPPTHTEPHVHVQEQDLVCSLSAVVLITSPKGQHW